VVEEPLPVVVPASEAVQGRSRLYEAAQAREAAAGALRAGTRRRLGQAMSGGRSPDPSVLVPAVAGRTGRQPAEVAALLYGAAGPGQTGQGQTSPPLDDAALVRLADELDQLEREVRAR
jgi:hypothetical protein